MIFIWICARRPVYRCAVRGSPYSNDQLRLGGRFSEPGRVGQTVFFDLPIPARHEGAHITGVEASVTSGLAVKIVSTTFQRTGQNQAAGFPLSDQFCVAGDQRPQDWLRIAPSPTSRTGPTVS
jgi:hypothetical protein